MLLNAHRAERPATSQGEPERLRTNGFQPRPGHRQLPSALLSGKGKAAAVPEQDRHEDPGHGERLEIAGRFQITQVHRIEADQRVEQALLRTTILRTAPRASGFLVTPPQDTHGRHLVVRHRSSEDIRTRVAPTSTT